MRNGHYYLGADLGGTSLRVGAVTANGEVAHVLSAPTGREFGTDRLRTELGTMLSRLRSVVHATEWVGAGFGTAGVVGNDGPLQSVENMPRLVGCDLRPLVEDVAGCDVVVENDARCFTLAEARYGAAKGARDVCGITLGTGVGCGVMVDGVLHRGVGSQAGEVCRIPLRGHELEYFLSSAGLVRSYVEAGGVMKDPGGVQLAAAAREGDLAAEAAWRSFTADVAFLCRCIIAILEPEVIVIGGALSMARDLIEPGLDHSLTDVATSVVFGSLGPHAGVIGAAALVNGRAPASRGRWTDRVDASEIER
jgi:glucokinase